MRITNAMITNNMLLGLNRNREALARFDDQLASGKKIQKPSDDPIIAARALKFRTTVSEIEQYKTNADDAKSWLGVTEQAINNSTEVLKRMRYLCVQGANGSLTADDRQKIIAEIAELKGQMANEGNSSYAGRYVFAGYSTDVSLVLDESITDQYDITQEFTDQEVETVEKVFNNTINQVKRIRLGYQSVSNSGPLTIAGFTVNTLNSTTTGAYDVAAGQVNFLEDTGELVFNGSDTPPSPLTVTYSKNNFQKGDLRPEHYFDCTNVTTGVSSTKKEEMMKYEISYSQKIEVNVMGSDFLTNDMMRNLEELIEATTSIKEDDSVADELNKGLVAKRFGEMITQLDQSIKTNLNAAAEVGGKINRLDLTLNRLEEDNLTFSDLLSKNEDINWQETYIKFSEQKMVYNAALKASGSVIQSSLLDFIR